MKRVILWFVLIFSFQVVCLVIMEAAGGSYNVFNSPSPVVLALFGVVSAILLFYSSFKIYSNRKEEIK